MARTPDPGEAEFVRRVREPRARSVEPGRHRARRSAMMLLYQSDLVGGDAAALIAGYRHEHGVQLAAYAQELIEGVLADIPVLDEQIGAHSHEWSVERLGAVERAILRVAMYELRAGAVPAPVVIDEAVELSKRYATPEAARLVNGVLAGWLRSEGDTASREETNADA